MTMDVYQRTIRADSSPPISVDDFRDLPPTTAPTIFQQTPVKKPSKPTKRSFDVAFLMAPDDLSKKRNNANGGTGVVEDKLEVKKPFKYSPPSESDLYRNYMDGQYQINPLSLTIHHDKMVRDEPAPRSPDSLVDTKDPPFFVRSAFTKVNSSSGFPLEAMIPRTPPIAVSPSSVSSTASNRSGMSPDLTYQDSLSPQPFQPMNRSPVQMIPSSTASGSPGKYQNSVMPNAANLQYFVASQLNNPLLKDMKNEDKAFSVEEPVKSKLKGMPPTTKQNFPYHADNLGIPYTGFPMTTFPFSPTLTPAASTPVPIFPTTANLTAALLPPSLAALSLPAQNVCAKCNMHFRMTSDLVYHMRSHHKNENNVIDPYKRRRDQDKLKCPVCNESFRERHHLTRHMTAHQDKDDEESNKEFVDVTHQTPISGSAK